MAKHRSAKIKDDTQLIAEIKTKDFVGYSLEEVLGLRQHPNKKEILDQLDQFVKASARGITSSQLRKLYDTVIGAESVVKIQIQRPQFSYLIAKQPNEEARKLMIFVDELAKLTTEEERVKDFKWIFEAIVAFHKYHEVLSDRRARNPADKILSSIERKLNIQHLLAINEVPNIDATLESLEKWLAEEVVKDLSSTQIRKIYDKILFADDSNDIQLLRPFFAYTTARQDREGGVKMMLLLLELCKQFDPQKNQLTVFKQAVETIVSFHKYYDTTSERKKAADNLLKDVFQKYFKDKKSRDLLTGTTDYTAFQNGINHLVLDNLAGVTSAQLRKLYDEVQEVTIRELKLKRPLFLYLIGRQKGDSAKRIMLLLDDLIKKIKSEEELERFQQIMEDVVAYHKYYDVFKLANQEIL